MRKRVLSEKIALLSLCCWLSAVTLPVSAGDLPAATTTDTATNASNPVPSAAATASTTADSEQADNTPAPKVMWKPGESLETSTDTEDIIATYDIGLAQKQVAAYPDSPEAGFILAVALTRTSRVEEALKEVQRARKLAESKGGPAYFDKMIESYEKMLTGYPNDNQVRYGLAWAYYMKAYLLGRHSRKVAAWKAANTPQADGAPAQTADGGKVNNAEVVKALKTGNPTNALSTIASIASGQVKPENLPHIPTALEKVDPADIPQIKAYYEKALQKIDEILQREPDDIWSIVYGAHLRAEYTGNLENAMSTWRAAASKHPNNPAPYFFLGEGYLKQGNLKESINNVSKAVALRFVGN